MRRVVALTLGVVCVVAACVAIPNEGDPNAPVLVTGHVENANRVRVANARLRLQVPDLYHAQSGQIPPDLLDRSFVADALGSFTIRLAPADVEAVDSLAVVNGETFYLSVDEGSSVKFDRWITESAWSDDVPVVVLLVPGVSGDRTRWPELHWG